MIRKINILFIICLLTISSCGKKSEPTYKVKIETFERNINFQYYEI